ncbi:unnamed protein product [Heterobilharzia americana]|nr:unnamed protein product [Heterobilharzia americana]
MNNNTTGNTINNSKGDTKTYSETPVTFCQISSPSGNHLRQPYRRRRDFSKNMKRKAQVSNHTSKHEIKITPWTPGDDYLLINSVVMMCNLTEVYHTVKFAVRYTEEEIENRWHDLLFDPIVSCTTLKAIAHLPSIIKSQLDRQVPFSSQEDNVIAQISFSDVFPDGVLKSLSIYDLSCSIFTEILRKNPTIFYVGRDELDIYRQWCRFYSCHSLTQDEGKLKSKATSIPSCPMNSSSITAPTTVGTLTMNRESTSISKEDNFSTSIALGGDAESFPDTELLLEETVANAISAGINKLTEQSSMTRRQHMLSQTSYHGFQGLVTQTVLEALIKESLSNQSNNPSFHSSPISASPHYFALTSPSPRATELTRLSSTYDQNYSAAPESDKPRSSLMLQSSILPVVNHQAFDQKRRLELHRRRGRLWGRLRRTKEEASRWTRLVETCVADGLEIMDPQPVYPALASLTGSRTQFLIKQKKVIFGRRSFVYQPHIDLSNEGDSARVSRCHGQIRLDNDGIFWLANFSSHTVYVDGNPILTDEEVELKDLATILISHMAFRFDVNHYYMNQLRNHVSNNSSNDNNTSNVDETANVSAVVDTSDDNHDSHYEMNITKPIIN